MKDKLILLFIILLMSTSCSTTSVQFYDQKPNAKVVVIGVGSDLASAKADAIRAAMALRTDQTVISEQLLVNDDMKTDMLASSMSGELSFFKVLDQTIDENGFTVIKAVIGINQKELKQKKSEHTASTGNRFSGSMISNQISSAKALKQAKKILEKNQLKEAKILTSVLFSGFPDRATEANLNKININPDNPEWVILKLSYELKKDWAQKLTERMALIEPMWNWKQNHADSNRLNIVVCKRGMWNSLWGGHCKALPIKPTLEDLSIRMLIPVFSSSGEYMTCLQTKIIPPLILEHKAGKYDPYGNWSGRSTWKKYYVFSKKPRKHSLWVHSEELYSQVDAADFFYPFVVSKEIEKSDAICEIEGKKRHAASGNYLLANQMDLISKTAARNKLHKNSIDDIPSHKSLNKRRKNYTVSPGSKIKYKYNG